MEKAPLCLYQLVDTVLADLGGRTDLPGSLSEWVVGIRGHLKPSLDELTKADTGGRDDIAAFLAGYGGAQANFQDLLFAIHTVSHFLQWEQPPFSEAASQRASTALVQMIKVYLFFLECLPTIQEQESAVLDLFVERYGDGDLQELQQRPPGLPGEPEARK